MWRHIGTSLTPHRVLPVSEMRPLALDKACVTVEGVKIKNKRLVGRVLYFDDEKQYCHGGVSATV